MKIKKKKKHSERVILITKKYKLLNPWRGVVFKK